MNKSQSKGHANESKEKAKEVAGKVTGDKNTEYKGETEKHGGKAESKYGNLKNDANNKFRISHSTTQLKSRYAAKIMQAAATLLNTATITGNEVYNMKDEKLGKIQDVVVDITDSQILYAVLASGGFMGMGDRLIAVPWKALKKDKEKNRFILDADVERLKNSPDFYKDRCPNVADVTWNSAIEPYHARRSNRPGG